MGKTYKDLVKEYCEQEFKVFVERSLHCDDIAIKRYLLGRAISFKQIIVFLEGSDLFVFQCNGVFEKCPILRMRYNTKDK